MWVGILWWILPRIQRIPVQGSTNPPLRLVHFVACHLHVWEPHLFIPKHAPGEVLLETEADHEEVTVLGINLGMRPDALTKKSIFFIMVLGI